LASPILWANGRLPVLIMWPRGGPKSCLRRRSTGRVTYSRSIAAACGPKFQNVSNDLNHARVLFRHPSCPGPLHLPLPAHRFPHHSVGHPAQFSLVVSSIVGGPLLQRIPGGITSTST
jgi:hypothetical protein